MNLKRQKTSIKNRKFTGGKKDTNYFTKKLKEFGLAVPKYLNKGITQKQFVSLKNKLLNKKLKYYIDKTITRNQPLLLSSDLSRVKRLDNMANCDNYNTSSTQSKKDEDKELKKKLVKLDLL